MDVAFFLCQWCDLLFKVDILVFNCESPAMPVQTRFQKKLMMCFGYNSEEFADRKEMEDAADTLILLRIGTVPPTTNLDITGRADDTLEERSKYINSMMLFLLSNEGNYLMSMCPASRDAIKEIIDLHSHGKNKYIEDFNMGRVWQKYFST